ncbi:hypothetical protein Bbelb_072600 [Branchiostoma belcheri]|nr:hypothetical protein Bbelb_072600 [Branchiostoma belcheri]
MTAGTTLSNSNNSDGKQFTLATSLCPSRTVSSCTCPGSKVSLVFHQHISVTSSPTARHDAVTECQMTRLDGVVRCFLHPSPTHNIHLFAPLPPTCHSASALFEKASGTYGYAKTTSDNEDIRENFPATLCSDNLARNQQFNQELPTELTTPDNSKSPHRKICRKCGRVSNISKNRHRNDRLTPYFVPPILQRTEEFTIFTNRQRVEIATAYFLLKKLTTPQFGETNTIKELKTLQIDEINNAGMGTRCIDSTGLSAWRRILFCTDHHRTDESKLSTTDTSLSVRWVWKGARSNHVDVGGGGASTGPKGGRSNHDKLDPKLQFEEPIQK